MASIRQLPSLFDLLLLSPGLPTVAGAESVPPARDAQIPELIDAVSPERLESDVETLVSFGTRHTLSETDSDTRGIGVARRWIEAEFRRISADCGDCLEVFTQTSVRPRSRSPEPSSRRPC